MQRIRRLTNPRQGVACNAEYETSRSPHKLCTVPPSQHPSASPMPHERSMMLLGFHLTFQVSSPCFHQISSKPSGVCVQYSEAGTRRPARLAWVGPLAYGHVSQSLPRWKHAVSASHVTPRQRRDAQCRKQIPGAKKKFDFPRLSTLPPAGSARTRLLVSMLRRLKQTRHIAACPWLAYCHFAHHQGCSMGFQLLGPGPNHKWARMAPRCLISPTCSLAAHKHSQRIARDMCMRHSPR